MRKALAALGMAALFAGAGMPAVAANIVTNGDFETDDAALASSSVIGYATGWTLSGSAAVQGTFSNSGVDGGTASALLGNGSFSQTLTTVAGVTYNISFWVGVDDPDLGIDSSAVFDATFGGTDLLSGQSVFVSNGVTGADVGPAVNSAGFEEFTASEVASGTSTTLSFTGSITGGDGPWYLDDVDVEATSTAAPEPSSLLLLLSVLAGLSLMRRRWG
jgi:hypothetical protein